uniref:Sulfotransferase domain-containing protein n=1 Tax=Chrysotila carterae TaxID=13221 RepID=A0A7S4F0F2_CHRCT
MESMTGDGACRLFLMRKQRRCCGILSVWLVLAFSCIYFTVTQLNAHERAAHPALPPGCQLLMKAAMTRRSGASKSAEWPPREGAKRVPFSGISTGAEAGGSVHVAPGFGPGSLSSLLASDDLFAELCAAVAARPAVHSCFALRDAVRCMPTFLVIGVTKAGTTAFFRYIKQHPSIAVSTVKEPAYFGAKYEEEEAAASARSAHAAANRDRNVPSRLGTYLSAFPTCDRCERGEATPSYAWRDFAAAAAAAAYQLLGPAIRLVMLVREPISRAKSHFEYFRTKRFRSSANFSEALALSLTEFESCAQSLGGWDYQCTYRPGRARVAAAAASVEGRHAVRPRRSAMEYELIQPALYVEHMRTWSVHFDPRSLLVLDAAALINDPDTVLASFESHMGIPRFRYTRINKHALPPSARETQGTSGTLVLRLNIPLPLTRYLTLATSIACEAACLC